MSGSTLTELRSAQKAVYAKIKVDRTFNMQNFHNEMQKRRNLGEDLTLKGFLSELWGEEYTPEKLYAEVGIDLKSMTINKLLQTSDLNRFFLPEIFRDAIRNGLLYTPFFRELIIGEETMESGSITMPQLGMPNPEDVRLRETREAARITEGEAVVYREKTVHIKKKARGLLQTYESIAFTPINLATIYFEELGTRFGADLDKEFIAILTNGDQADNSESAPVIGATVASTLAYIDIARTWVRFTRLYRQSSAMLMSEADALTVLNMPQFAEKPNNAGASSISGVTLRTKTPLPTDQDIYVHGSVPTGKILFVDPRRAAVQLTAMPLLVETEKIMARQLQAEWVSIMTGFANVFRDGRIMLDYMTNLSTNPGPTVPE